METNIDKEYQRILHNVECLLHTHGVTYQNQLNNFGKRIFGRRFAGVFASDRIPKLNSIKDMAIVNLDTSNEPGSHWIGMYKKPDSHNIYVYDSFNRKVSHILPTFTRYTPYHIEAIKSDKYVKQGNFESNCGQRCLTWLILVDKYGIEKVSKL